MQTLTLSVRQDDPLSLRVHDVTPAWEGQHLIRKYQISLEYPTADAVFYEYPAEAMAAGGITIDAQRLRAQQGLFGRHAVLPSGPLTLHVEAVGLVSDYAYKRHYTVLIPFLPPASAILEVRTDGGGWDRVTPEVIGKTWRWQLLSHTTFIPPTSYQLRVGDSVIDRGEVLAEEIDTTPVVREGWQSIARATVTVFISAAERQRWAEQVLSTVSGTGTFRVPGLSGQVMGDKVGRLGYLGGLLDLLDSGQYPSVTTAQQLLTRIQAELDLWN